MRVDSRHPAPFPTGVTAASPSVQSAPRVKGWAEAGRKACSTGRRERGSQCEPNGPTLARHAGRMYKAGPRSSGDRASVPNGLRSCVCLAGPGWMSASFSTSVLLHLASRPSPRYMAGSQTGIRCSRSTRGGWAAAGSGTAPREPKATGAASQTGANVIIVSKSSAEATQPERTGRYTPARRRSSAARDDTPGHADPRQISVHTEEVTGSIPVSPTQVRALMNDLAATDSLQYSNEVQQ